MRAIATVHSSSSASGSLAFAMPVPSLARKFWTMTSWMCPWRRCIVADRQKRVDPLGARFADADQDAGGQRDFRLPRRFDGCEPHLRPFVRRAVMWPAALAKPRRRAFQHDALRHGDPAERGNLGLGHHAGIDVRQQSGLAQDQRAHGGEIVDGRCMAEVRERAPCRLVFQFRLVAEREQRLAAAGGFPGPGDRQHVVRCEVSLRRRRAGRARRCNSGRCRGTAA